MREAELVAHERAPVDPVGEGVDGGDRDALEHGEAPEELDEPPLLGGAVGLEDAIEVSGYDCRKGGGDFVKQDRDWKRILATMRKIVAAAGLASAVTITSAIRR